MGVPELILIVLVLGGFVALPMCVVALVQCLCAEFREPDRKVMWALLVFLVPVVGPILWWAVGMKQRRLG